MLNPSELDEVRTYAKSQGIRLSGKNAFPQLTRFTPYKYPWAVNSEHDLELLAAGLEAATVLSDELDHNATLRGQPRPLTSWPQILKEGFSKRHIKSRRNLPAAPYFSHNSLTCFSHSTFCTSCLNRTDKGHSDIFLWH